MFTKLLSSEFECVLNLSIRVFDKAQFFCLFSIIQNRPVKNKRIKNSKNSITVDVGIILDKQVSGYLKKRI